MRKTLLFHKLNRADFKCDNRFLTFTPRIAKYGTFGSKFELFHFE